MKDRHVRHTQRNMNFSWGPFGGHHLGGDFYVHQPLLRELIQTHGMGMYVSKQSPQKKTVGLLSVSLEEPNGSPLFRKYVYEGIRIWLKGRS